MRNMAIITLVELEDYLEAAVVAHSNFPRGSMCDNERRDAINGILTAALGKPDHDGLKQCWTIIHDPRFKADVQPETFDAVVERLNQDPVLKRLVEDFEDAPTGVFVIDDHPAAAKQYED
jgi:hypothetical protein